MGVMQRVKRIADAMSADSPDRFVATVINSKHKAEILIDYLRNGRGSTAVAPYSTRAAWRCHIHAAGVGRTQSRNRAGLFHRRQRTYNSCAKDQSQCGSCKFQQSREAAERHLAIRNFAQLYFRYGKPALNFGQKNHCSHA
jgi:hypothetical protein